MDIQLIRYELDGKKKTIDSKEIDELLSRLKTAKKFCKMACGKKRKRRKMNTHKRKKRLRANRHKKKKV